MLQKILKQLNFTDKAIDSFYQLLTLTNCESTQTFPAVTEALKWLRDITQTNWLRKQGVERWDQEDSIFMDHHREEFLSLSEDIHLISQRLPKLKQYDICLLLGALQSDFEIRTDFMATLWEQGIRFNQIVVLGGQYRPLIPQKETVFFKGATELDMMHAIVDDRKPTWPIELQNVDTLFVDNLIKQFPGKTFTKRQNTFDTIKEWLTYKPSPGTVLIISNQPYIDYQHAVIRTALPKTFTIETVGSEALEDVRITTILDCIARRIYADYNYIYSKVGTGC